MKIQSQGRSRHDRPKGQTFIKDICSRRKVLGAKFLTICPEQGTRMSPFEHSIALPVMVLGLSGLILSVLSPDNILERCFVSLDSACTR